MILYIATNSVNGKRYVGHTTSSLRKRARKHELEAGKGSKTALHCAIRKYGIGVFVFEQVGSSWSRDLLKFAERALIEQEGTLAPGGYNITKGGDGFSGKHRPDSLKKMSRAQKKVHQLETDEQRLARGAAISRAKRGKPQPWGKLIGDRLRGIKRPSSFKQAVSAGMRRYVSGLPAGEMSRRARGRSL